MHLAHHCIMQMYICIYIYKSPHLLHMFGPVFIYFRMSFKRLPVNAYIKLPPGLLLCHNSIATCAGAIPLHMGLDSCKLKSQIIQVYGWMSRIYGLRATPHCDDPQTRTTVEFHCQSEATAACVHVRREIKCHPNSSVTQIRVSLKIECRWISPATQNWVSLDFECHT